MYRGRHIGLALFLGLATSVAWSASDPTRPPQALRAPTASATTSVAPLRLESVIMGADRRLAVINGRPLREGDRLGTARLVAIERSAVVVEVEGERRRLQVHRGLQSKQSIKREAK